MSYDPLLQRAKNAKTTLESRIRAAKRDKDKAETELQLLYVLEAELNLDAIIDAIPDGGSDNG